MPQDGSMSADEYLAAAAELNQEQQDLDGRRRALETSWQERNRQQQVPRLDHNVLAAQFQRAVNGQPATVTYTQGSNGTAARREEREASFSDAELTIEGVQHLPTRVRGRELAHPGLQSMSDAMREQQDSGRYPTIEQHMDRVSPAYELIMHTFGSFRHRRLTPEEEHAIRHRLA
jgi:hypothetical protein